MIRLNPDEKIILMRHRHWFVLASEILFLIFLFLAFVTGALFVRRFIGGGKIMPLLILIVAHLMWIILFIILADYFLDAWIVTNERILDIEQKGLFNREFSEFKLDKIQDVTVDIVGIIPTLMHYGSVHIQTAGESREFVFEQIPRPHEVKNIVLKAHDQFESHHHLLT